MNMLLAATFGEFQLPEWLTFGTAITAVLNAVGFVVACMKLRASGKENNLRTTTQIGLLTTMSEKLSDTKKLSAIVSGTLEKTEEALVEMQKLQEAQKKFNLSVATYIMECFQASNLSDDKKLQLKVKYDQLFYDSNYDIIEVLKAEKLAAEEKLAQNEKDIADLQEQVEIEKRKLESVQNNVKKSRRIE